MNFLTLYNTALPYSSATITDEKLSSKRTISQAFLATSVPVIPIANQTSAFLRAGASLVPSPVTAITPSNCCIPVTRRNLSSGELLARTLNYFFTSLNLLRFPTTFFSVPSSSVTVLTSPTYSLNY